MKPGDTLPDVVLSEGQVDMAPPKDIKLRDVFKGKLGVLLGVPGAFTPGCSKSHVPSFISEFDALKKAGVEVIVCTATNDGFVMYAWGKSLNADGKVLMLADANFELATALGVAKESGRFTRSGRYSALIRDNKILTAHVADDGGGMPVTLANVILDDIKAGAAKEHT